MKYQVYPGEPYPLGATWDGEGVNFAVFAENAAGMDLCLFDTLESKNEEERIRLNEVSHHVWHAYIPGLKPGQLYGYRAYGSYEPMNGLRYNPNKLLIDPYAKAISSPVRWNDAGEAAESVHDSQRRLSMANRAPRGDLLVDAGRHHRGTTIHQRFHLRVGRGEQEILDGHDAEERVSLTHDNVGGAFVTPSNQELPHRTGQLEGSGDWYALGGVFGCGFERQVRLTLRWLAGVDGVHRPIPPGMVSVSYEELRARRRESAARQPPAHEAGRFAVLT